MPDVHISSGSATGLSTVEKAVSASEPAAKVSRLSRDPLDIHIGSRLRLLRSGRDMTLQQAGDGVGITYQQIRKYESGENRLSASMLYRLSRLFGVEPAFFFEGLGKQAKAEAEEASQEKEPALQDALARIEDEEIRTHLERLIATLEKRK